VGTKLWSYKKAVLSITIRMWMSFKCLGTPLTPVIYILIDCGLILVAYCNTIYDVLFPANIAWLIQYIEQLWLKSAVCMKLAEKEPCIRCVSKVCPEGKKEIVGWSVVLACRICKYLFTCWLNRSGSCSLPKAKIDW